jgi:hypothetical protein
MRLVVVLSAVFFSLNGLANPGLPIKVKDRLRLVLWYEGLRETQLEKKSETAPTVNLKEEISKPLGKF